jgi:hypothetical protein
MESRLGATPRLSNYVGQTPRKRTSVWHLNREVCEESNSSHTPQGLIGYLRS